MFDQKEYNARYRAEHRDVLLVKDRQTSATWRANNPDKVKEQNARKYNRHVERLAQARSGGCVDCGSTENLHLHHIDPTTKLYNVARMVGHSDRTFWAEVAKCVALCQDCHVERHRVMEVAA